MFQFFKRATPVCLLFVALLLAGACSNLAGDRSLSANPANPSDSAMAESRTPAGPVVARINGREVHRRELDQWLKDDWLRGIEDDPTKLYELHRAGIDGVIDDSLIDRAAASAGLSSDAFLERESSALGPVTQKEVDEFYVRYKDRIEPVESLEKLRPKIRKFLEADRPVRVVTKLRHDAKIEILLTRPPPPPVERHQVAAGGASRGPADAQVTIVEFSDYQCPFCQRTEATLKQLDQLYPGKIRFVYRHFPLDFHKNALPAAKAAVCAEQQSRFWDYHDLLFANQRSLSLANLLQYAGQLRLDLKSFQACLVADGTQQRIELDMAAARTIGAKATPTFFINGIMLRGAQGLEAFRSIIDRELAANHDP